MKLRRRRDNQQWMLDHMVKTTGRVQNFASDRRVVPPQAKSYDMVPKVLAQEGLHAETIGRAADAAGHRYTALQAYCKAMACYVEAQHSIFRGRPPGQGLLVHAGAGAARARARAGGPSHRAGGGALGGALAARHAAPAARPRPSPHALLYPRRMDGTKESSGVGPLGSVFMPHGVHVFTMDGPGQGESNLRKTRITDDNYERAVSAAIDYLSSRPEVDTDRIGIVGSSFGSLWGIRAAARDPRIKALAVVAVCFGDKREIFEQASPRFKQVFMYMAGIQDEDEFDQMAERMTADGYGPSVRCPTLICAGEFDPLTHLDEVEELFEDLAGPKELWVFENQFHEYRGLPNLAEVDTVHFMIDWLLDAMDGKLAAGHRRVTLVPQHTGAGPFQDRPLFGPWRSGGNGAVRAATGVEASLKGPD